jgi:GDP-L-fucose synthase
MKHDTPIYLAGHRGLVGSSVLRRLEAVGYRNIVTRTHRELDLTRQADLESFFETERPEVVIFAAARVGGILANDTYKAEFIYQNITMAANVVHAAWKSGVKKLLNLGSSCIYPKFSPQPMSEDHLLSDTLEPTNEPYAIAKIAAIKLCRYYNEQYGTNFVSAMPTNLYGPGDNFDLETSHVLPALLRKFADAAPTNAPVTVWGDGSPMREFLYVDDLADALVYLLEHVDAPDMREVSPGLLRQRRYRRGRHDPRARRDDCRCGGVEGRDPLGQHQTERHPPQAHGCDQDDRAWLDRLNEPAGGHRRDLEVVYRART